MNHTTVIFLQSVIGNIVVGIGIVSILLLVRIFKERLNKKLTYITALTVGLLLGIVFLGFLPEIFEETKNPGRLSMFILTGIILFYILELILHNHHCKELQGEYKHKEHNSAHLMFNATLLHNMFHGIVLFAAFTSSFNLGVITTIAILLHSIPQNIANYFLSMKKEKLVFIAALGGVIGALILFPFKDILLKNEGIIISIISGGLLYIALSDILPEGKNNKNIKSKLIYLLFVIVGVLLFIGIKTLKMNLVGNAG